MTARVLESGLVHLPAAIDEAAQQVLAHVARAAGGGAVNGGFWCGGSKTPGDGADLNHSPTWGRGRVYAAIESFPRAAELRQICETVVAAACEADSSMPSMSPTHLLLNYYGKGCGITTHVDDAENDGEGSRPVVSISLGNTSNFELKHKRHSWKHGYTCDNPPGPCHRVTLSSSDALLFGGACRLIQHTIVGRTLQDGTSVRAISLGTAPPHLDLGPELIPGNGVRVSFTFRQTSMVLGNEHKYVAFNPTTTKRKRKVPKSTSIPTKNACDDPGLFDVEDIIDKRTRRGEAQYLVLWQGFATNESTWEPLSHLKSAMGLVQAFESKTGQERKARTSPETAATVITAVSESSADPLVGMRVEKAFGEQLCGGIVARSVASGAQYLVQYYDGDCELLAKEEVLRISAAPHHTSSPSQTRKVGCTGQTRRQRQQQPQQPQQPMEDQIKQKQTKRETASTTAAENDEDSEEWYPERIVGVGIDSNGRRCYKIKWYNSQDVSFEPIERVQSESAFHDVIERYFRGDSACARRARQKGDNAAAGQMAPFSEQNLGCLHRHQKVTAELPELAREVIRLAEDESHGLHAIAKALHHHRRDLRRTADPLPVARACRVIAASRIPQTAIVVNQKLPPVGVSQVWEICFPRAGERWKLAQADSKRWTLQSLSFS